MKILINATANNIRGPLSLTKSFLKDLVNNDNFLKQNNVQIKVLVSVKELIYMTTDTVKIEFNVMAKKSFLHKFYHEQIFIPSILQKEKYDAYLSLQNTGVKKGPYKQYILIHTPLPFEQLSTDDLETKNFLKYKFLLRNTIKVQMKNMDSIIVQTNWMKAAIKELGYKKNITIIRPDIPNLTELNDPLEIETKRKIDNSNDYKLFYPTNIEKYKNNERAIIALGKYNETATHKAVLYLTLEGQDTDYVKYLGKVKYESMYNLYISMDALLFPSLTETLGLPLQEAVQCGLPRIVSNRKYAKEICGDAAIYFDPTSIQSIVKGIRTFTEAGSGCKDVTNLKKAYDSHQDYLDYIKLILNTR